MEYREQLLSFILEGRQQEMGAWIKEHSPLEQLQIMNEFKELMEELAKESGLDMDDELDKFEVVVTDYQEKILDDQMTSLKAEMKEKYVAEKRAEADKAYVNLKNKIIENIKSNPPNVAELRKVAADIMQLEKDYGVFDPADWQDIL